MFLQYYLMFFVKKSEPLRLQYPPLRWNNWDSFVEQMEFSTARVTLHNSQGNYLTERKPLSMYISENSAYTSDFQIA